MPVVLTTLTDQIAFKLGLREIELLDLSEKYVALQAELEALKVKMAKDGKESPKPAPSEKKANGSHDRPRP